MLVHARLAALLTVLGLGSVAHARPITSAEDPALVGAVTHGFEDLADASPGAAAFVVGRTLVTIEAGAAPPGDILQCSDAGDCRLTTYMTAPVTITFDPPVSALGMFMWYSVGSFAMVVTGDAATEVLDAASIGWQPPDSAYAGAAEIGAISTVLLTAADYSTYWDDLRFVEGSDAGSGVDVALSSPAADRTAAPGDLFAVDVRAHNFGPDAATATEIVVLSPSGAVVDETTPAAELDDTHVTFAIGELAAGAEADVSVQSLAPAAASFGCDDTLRTIAVVHHAGGDSVPGNGIVAVDTAFDRTRGAAAEDCESFADDDCDGLVNCLDADCLGTTPCPVAATDLGQQPFPPQIPWIDEPADPLADLAQWSDPWNLPSEPQECEVSDNHGGTTLRPIMCCGPAPSASSEHPSYLQWWTACTPIDPNFKAATPAANALGFGTTAAGETIAYTITYENVGGVAAHDVIVLDVLSAELDDATIMVDDGGLYDPATRTLSWIDPVLPPHEPHTVHYEVAVRDDAPVGTRVQNTATIVFQDAVPPSRVDTAPLVHVIPGPDTTAAADLRIAACTPIDDEQWEVRIVNAGLAPAYDARARIVDAPDDFVIDDDGCAFAHPSDPDPTAIAIAIPWATTGAIDTVRFTAPDGHEDPCAELTWELTYFTPGGELRTTMSRLERDGGGTEDSGGGSSGGGAQEGDGGCACRSHARGSATPSLGLLLLGLGAARRRRHPRVARAPSRSAPRVPAAASAAMIR